MKKKNIIIVSLIVVLLAVVAWIYFKVPSTKNDTTAKQTVPTGMENMDMDNKTDSSKIHDVSLHTLLQPTNSYAITSIPTTTLTKSTQQIEINTLGYTAYNTSEVGAIAARINGRIEHLSVKYRYQLIKRGQKIMDIYSPELLTAQQNLLFILKNDPLNTSLIDAAKERLILLGFPYEQLKQVINTKKPLFAVPVYTNYSGHIHEALGNEMNSPVPAMNEGSALTTQELGLKEGMYLQKGQTVFKVYNPNRIWILLNIYPSDQALIKVGNKVKIISEAQPEEEFHSSINFIEPSFRSGSKTLAARINFDNRESKLPIGSQVKATIYSHPLVAEWLPKDAVLSLGLEKVVFVKTGKGYSARKIETGITYKNLIQIKSGITKADSVAANAQFLMDSESFIKVQN